MIHRLKRFWIRLIAALPLAETTILFVDGAARVHRGKASFTLITDLNDIARKNDVGDACIHATSGAGGFRLSMYGLPGNVQQRIRNVWGVSR